MADGGESETKLMHEEGDGVEEEQSEYLPNASLLPQLNLAIVVLSLLSSSSEEGLDPEKVNAAAKGGHEYEANNAHMKNLHTRRRGMMHECKYLGERKGSKVQTSVRDFRHGKKM